MTEKQKKWTIIAVVLIALLLFLWPRKAGGTTIINQEGAAPINVTIPSLNIPPRSPISINIPGLPSASPYDYNAISPCMCNGAAGDTGSGYSGPLVSMVINEGSTGPNVYNYSGGGGSSATPQCPPGMFWDRTWNTCAPIFRFYA